MPRKRGLADLPYPQQMGPRRSPFDERFRQMLDAIMHQQMQKAQGIEDAVPWGWYQPAVGPPPQYPQAPGYFMYGRAVKAG